jgi:L-amino acid N-acyltransferase YncA
MRCALWAEPLTQSTSYWLDQTAVRQGSSPWSTRLLSSESISFSKGASGRLSALCVRVAARGSLGRLSPARTYGDRRTRAQLVMEVTMDAQVCAMRDGDWSSVRAIYRQGIATGQATFEMDVPNWSEWNASHLIACRLVARQDGRIVGWAALSPVSGRPVYSGVAEVSVYVAASARRRGIGSALLNQLVADSERADIWTLQASVFPENLASVLLHVVCGFRKVGYRERIGQMDGVWRDTVLMERRSATVGVGAVLTVR